MTLELLVLLYIQVKGVKNMKPLILQHITLNSRTLLMTTLKWDNIHII